VGPTTPHSTATTQVTPTAFKRIVDKIQGLPTLPTVVMELLSIARDPNASANEMEAGLQHDPSLTMKIMRMANSSFYGYGNIKTLNQAIVVLGFPVIKSIILAASVFEAFPGAGRPGFDRAAFWKHSLGVAVTSRMIAQRVTRKDIEEAFVAGLVHDIGKVILDEYASDLWDRVIARTKEKNCLVFDSEMALFGFSHAQVGQWLAMKWKLPQDYTAAIFYHHQPSYARQGESLTAIVHIADIITRTVKIGSGGDPLIPAVDKSAWDRIEMTQQVFDDLVAAVPAEFERANASFGGSQTK
jgi:putative nucleotidyltransferase with HDIG domain